MKIDKIFNSNTKTPIATGVVGFVVGAGVSYGITYFLNRNKFVEESTPYIVPKVATSSEDEDKQPGEEDTEAVEKRFFNPADIGREFVSDKLKDPVVITPVAEPEVEEPIARSIFASTPGTDEEWDYDEEVKHRSSDAPYIIHKDEFYANELEYTQITLTYYAGDDILVDEEDVPVYNHNQIVGKLKFGHGSGDPNVVHVRNDKMKAEYEILRDSGMYSVEVLNLSIENNARTNDLRHSSHVPRFYKDD